MFKNYFFNCIDLIKSNFKEFKNVFKLSHNELKDKLSSPEFELAINMLKAWGGYSEPTKTCERQFNLIMYAFIKTLNETSKE